MDRSVKGKSRAGRVAAVCGAVVGLLGTASLVAWHVGASTWLRPVPHCPVMTYNGAVVLAVIGFALVCAAVGRAGPALAGGVVAVAFGLLTLFEHATGQALPIDFRFAPALVGSGDRLSTNTAVALALLGSGLLLLAEPEPTARRPKVLALFGPIVFALGSVALFGYATGMESAYRWGDSPPLPPVTALALAFAGAGLGAFAWRDGALLGVRPTWLPLLVGVGVGTASVLLGYALNQREQEQQHETLVAQAEGVRIEIESRLLARLEALERMARRWEYGRTLDLARLEFDARLYLAQYPGQQALEWIDPAYRVRWVVPERGNEVMAAFDLRRSGARRRLLDQARRRGEITVSETLPLIQGGQGFLAYVPLTVDGRDRGALAGVFRVRELFDSFLAVSRSERPYGLRVREQVPIYVLGAEPGPEDAVEVLPLQVYDTRWRLEVWPLPAARRPLRLSQVAMVSGLVMAWLLAVATHLAQAAYRHARASDLANAELAREVRFRQQAQDALTERTRELERSNADLEQFAYVASHDLQEPLRMVASYLQLIERRYVDRLDDDGREFIGYAVDGANRMRALVNDLLAFSRVGTRGHPFQPCDLGVLAEQVRDNLELTIVETGATLNVGPLPTVPGDATQLTQLLQNLVGNALKFAGEQPPVITVGAELADGQWTVSVADNGIGIDPKHAERVFLIFQRLHSRTEYDGTGIGLAICKKIVERHGGRIWVEPGQGGGSVFRFTLDAGERER